MSSLNQQTQHKLSTPGGEEVTVYSLSKLEQLKGGSIKRLPYSIRVLVENLLRNQNDRTISEEDIINA